MGLWPFSGQISGHLWAISVPFIKILKQRPGFYINIKTIARKLPRNVPEMSEKWGGKKLSIYQFINCLEMAKKNGKGQKKPGNGQEKGYKTSPLSTLCKLKIS